MRQHEAVVQLGAPVDEGLGVGRFPEVRNECANQQHLQCTHLPVGRHLEVSELDDAQATTGAVW